MPTALTRDTARVVSEDLVATLTKRGLVLRRPRCRKKVLVRWEDLEREYLHDAATGVEAFERPLPKRWLPSVGEEVWVRPVEKVWRGETVKVLPGMGEETVVVRPGGKKLREVRVLLSQTRPLGV